MPIWQAAPPSSTQVGQQVPGSVSRWEPAAHLKLGHTFGHVETQVGQQAPGCTASTELLGQLMTPHLTLLQLPAPLAPTLLDPPTLLEPPTLIEPAAPTPVAPPTPTLLDPALADAEPARPALAELLPPLTGSSSTSRVA